MINKNNHHIVTKTLWNGHRLVRGGYYYFGDMEIAQMHAGIIHI